MTKLSAKGLARELRSAGHSYAFIAEHVHVSKGTLSVWLANVPYTPNTETIARIGKARAASGAAKARLKLESIEKARCVANEEMGAISARDLFMLGLGLYIGEGAKSDQMICVVNANPRIVRVMINWLIDALKVPKSNLRLRLHLYPDNDESLCIQYWSSETGISPQQFERSVIDRRTNKKAVKAGKLPYGTAHLSVRSGGDKSLGVFLARKIAAWSDRVTTVE